MCTGKLDTLAGENADFIDVYEVDIAANEQVLVGSIYEPGVMGIVVDAIGFDSNNGIIYYVGAPME